MLKLLPRRTYSLHDQGCSFSRVAAAPGRLVTTRHHALAVAHVAAAERPPGYIQRPQRRSAKKRLPNNERIGESSEAAGQQQPGANGTGWHTQQDEQHMLWRGQQLLQEQQLLLQQQWQKQQEQELLLQQSERQDEQPRLQHEHTLQEQQVPEQVHQQQRRQQQLLSVQLQRKQQAQLHLQEASVWQQQQQQNLQEMPRQRLGQVPDHQQQQQQAQLQWQQRQQHPQQQQQQHFQRHQQQQQSPPLIRQQQQPWQQRQQQFQAQQKQLQQRHPSPYAPVYSAPQSALHTSAVLQQRNQHGHSSSSSMYSSSSSSSAAPPMSSAYSVVPNPTAPLVAAAAARGAARAASAAAVAGAHSSSSSSGGLALLPTEQCVPRQFWGLMNEELRPWHKQVLVHLCYCLPEPACFIYRDMRAGTMQGVLAQRAVVEKQLRALLMEVEWQMRRLQGWLDTVVQKDGGYVNPDTLQQCQQELQKLKADIGVCRKRLQQLQAKARTYSDADYIQYSSAFDAFLQDMDQICEAAQAQRQVDLILRVQDIKEQAARKTLFARTADAVQAVQSAAAAVVQQAVQQQQQQRRAVQQQARGLKQQMQEFSWRYPPREYVLWRHKGRAWASKPPLVMPGFKRKMPTVRRGTEQLP